MFSRRGFFRWIFGFGSLGLAATTYGVLIEPFLRLRVTRYALRPPRWPAGFGLTIAVIADVHACRPWMTPRGIGSVVELTNSLGADLIVLLGDYVAGHRFVTGKVDPDEWSSALSVLRAPLGVHAILGNHDWWDDLEVQRAGRGSPYARRALEAVGISVHENSAVRLYKEGHAFWLAGLGDQLAFLPMRRQRPGQRIGVDDLPGTLAQVTDNAPVILLAHEPDVLGGMPSPERIALMLSGHTHGGQVRLFGWSPVVPSRFGNRYAYGHVRDGCDLIVSGGLGCSILPVRFGVPPEVVLVQLG